MKLGHLFTILLFFLLSKESLSKEYIAKIIKLKGSATVLAPSEKEAKKLKVGMKLLKDSSVVTYEKSFLIVEYDDQSKVTVGPKSKVVINKVSKGAVGMINLLKGRIKAKVFKEKKSSKNKFYVKTLNAAMGVRGTTFQTTFNTENNLTSIVTFDGVVAFKKIKKVQKVNLESTLDKSTTKVNIGRYSGVSENLESETVPVQISPRQFTLLKMNESFGVDKKKFSKKSFNSELKKTYKLYKEDKTKDPEVLYDPDTKKYRPRAGGLVDLKTGIYIPPEKGAKKIKGLNIFKASSKIGQVKVEGDYVPPKGLTLDAKKGFIALSGKKTRKNSQALKELNSNIAGQVILPKKPEKSDLDNLIDNAYDRYFKVD